MNKSTEKIYCRGGGCGAKLGPAALNKVLSNIEKLEDPNLLVGFDSSDDAAVYKIDEDTAVVQTLDFFPPMVSDPYTFGQIAATNALSDIYAMGASFKTALNIVCFPENEDLNILGKIIEGGSDKVHEAGGNLVGGHSINDTSIKYGMSVMGTVNPSKIYQNDKAKPGDVLILTKPLGVGIILSASNVGHADEETLNCAVKNMTTLNKTAAEISKDYKINACTDVTGFGLITHLLEMLGDNKTSANIKFSDIPIIDEAYDYAKDFFITAAGQRNRNFAVNKINFEIDDYAAEELLFDPQTSGGLLFSVDEKDAENFVKDLSKVYNQASIIGTVVERDDSKIIVN